MVAWPVPRLPGLVVFAGNGLFGPDGPLLSARLARGCPFNGLPSYGGTRENARQQRDFAGKLWSRQSGGRVGRSGDDRLVCDFLVSRAVHRLVSLAAREALPRFVTLFCTGRKTVPERVHGRDAGADDYLVKPIEGDELLARLRAAVRRDQAHPKNTLTPGDCELDLTGPTVSQSGAQVPLTRREFSVLRVLALPPIGAAGSGISTRRQRQIKPEWL